MPSFHEDTFPHDIAYGSSGGPKFSTTVFEAASGAEQRNINWSKVRAEYNVGLGIRSYDMMADVIKFFMARQGKAYGFRFRDWMDYKIGNQNIGTGNGVQTAFQLVKTYTSGSVTYTRTIKKPVSGTLTTVSVNAVNTTAFTVDYTTGIFTFTTPPANGHAIVVAYVEFDVPVRFDTDQIDAQHDFWNTGSWPQIKLVELKL